MKSETAIEKRKINKPAIVAFSLCFVFLLGFFAMFFNSKLYDDILRKTGVSRGGVL